MYTLHPTLWRTCRAIANEKRIRLLFAIFDYKNCSVSELANSVGISESHASLHLRTLSARGLIRQYRHDQYLLCTPEANIEIESAMLLLEALRECHRQKISPSKIMKQATAFTHTRRIEVIQKIPTEGSTKDL
jgi:predicted transcriptional regulator